MLGTAGGLMMLFAATASIAGNLNGQVLVTARTLFAMAERGQLFSAVSRIHERFHTPHLAILITAGVMLAFAVSGTFVQLATISVGSRLVVYGATCAALPVLRRRDDLEAGEFRAPAGPALAMVSLAICVWLLSNSTPRELSAFTTLAIVGVVVYAGLSAGRVREAFAMTIRAATIADLPSIVDIYNDAVADRFATADTSPVTVDQRRRGSRHTTTSTRSTCSNTKGRSARGTRSALTGLDAPPCAGRLNCPITSAPCAAAAATARPWSRTRWPKRDASASACSSASSSSEMRRASA
jgi:hypothetical protein